MAVVFAALIALPAEAAGQTGGRYERRVWDANPLSWSSRDELARHAHELSENSLRLYRAMVQVDTYGQFARMARSLAVIAERLHQDVEGGAPQGVLLGDYDALQQELQTLRARLFDAHQVHHGLHVQHLWGNVMAAHERVALSLSVPSTALCAYAGPPWNDGHGTGHDYDPAREHRYDAPNPPPQQPRVRVLPRR
jgi:hypothetical protein